MRYEPKRDGDISVAFETCWLCWGIPCVRNQYRSGEQIRQFSKYLGSQSINDECVVMKVIRKTTSHSSRINEPHEFRNHIDDYTIYRGEGLYRVLLLHTSSLVMLREHFLREGPKGLILADHLGDIRLHKQRKSLPRYTLHSWSRADSNTVRGRTEPARSGNLQCLPSLKRKAVGWDRYLYELPSARSNV